MSVAAADAPCLPGEPRHLASASGAAVGSLSIAGVYVPLGDASSALDKVFCTTRLSHGTGGLC